MIFCVKISFVSGDGGMADALDSGSSGSLSCEGSSPFLRIRKREAELKQFGFRAVFISSINKTGILVIRD